MRHIVIAGGGFTGIVCAMALLKKKLNNVKITLISDNVHFEYYPRIYHAVTNDNPAEVCVCLSEIFHNKDINLVYDKIINVDPNQKIIQTDKKNYKYDELVLALGSETVYFDIEGLKERAFGFKSIKEALTLKKHLHKMFDVYLSSSKEDLVNQLHIVVVGGGPSGVELAGRLTSFMRDLATKHSVDNNFVTIDLVESSPRLISLLPEEISKKVQKRLHKLGVNIFLNRTVVRGDVDEITMKDMSVKSNTLIWTAGARINSLYQKIPGLNFKNNNRIIVDEYLQVFDIEGLYIGGDAASTKYSGFAQTAIYDGKFIAENILRKLQGKNFKKYKPKKIGFAVPVGRGWAAIGFGRFYMYGLLASIVRDLIDIHFFLSIMPFRRVMNMFIFKKHKRKICDNCKSF